MQYCISYFTIILNFIYYITQQNYLIITINKFYMNKTHDYREEFRIQLILIILFKILTIIFP